MARPWSRKQTQPSERPPDSDPGPPVHLDDDADHAWWTQEDVKEVWRPRARAIPGADAKPERDILAEHFGADWRTSFGFTPPTGDQAADGDGERPVIDDEDPYTVLRVARTASWDEIVAAHRHLARLHHPDLLFGQSAEQKAASEERMRVINAAYKELRIRRGM